jgi:hypothetical protein
MAAIVVAAVGGIFIGMAIAISIVLLKPSPQEPPEVGWDLVTTWHNLPAIWILVPLAVFVIGFLLGFRYFSKTEVR